MHHAEDLVRLGKQLRERGFRLTPQRLMILEAVSTEKGHVTAEAIHEVVADQYPDMSLSTVYRTLETLRDLGLVTQTDLGTGRIEYHYAEEAHHHHLVCRKCGTASEIDDTFMGSLSAMLLDSYGFRPEITHFAIFGVCAACDDSETL